MIRHYPPVCLKLAAAILVAVPAFAGDRPADDMLALKVQAAIADDPTLKPHHLNLLVTLVDGMAVIGGEVPDMALLPAVEQAARNVPGVRGVKVSGWLPAGREAGDPFQKRVAEQMGGPPAPPKPAQPVSPPMTILSKPPEPVQGRPVARTSVPPPAGLLMEPVVAGSVKAPAAPGAAPLPYPTIPPPGVPTQPVLLPAAGQPWDDLIRSETRFAGLQVRRDGRGVTVAGKAAKLADAWDFADKLHALLGTDVMVGAVEVR